MGTELGCSDKGRILVVDDEDAVGAILQRGLAKRGYYVRTATRFTDMQLLLQQEAYDLVTLDILMPEMDGLEVLRWIRGKYPDLGVVMATATEDTDTIIKAMRLGAYNYLIKPFDLALVEAEIEQAMARQRLVAENRSYQQELELKVEVQTRDLRHAYHQLERQVKELEGRDRLVHFQMSGHSVRQAQQEILQVVEQVLGIKRVIMYRPNETGDQLEAVAALEDGQQGDGLPAVSLGEETSLVEQVFRDGQPKQDTGSQAAVSLLYQDEAMGVLWVDGLPEADREQAGNALRRLGQEAALVLWSAGVAEDLESGQIQVDELLELSERSL